MDTRGNSYVATFNWHHMEFEQALDEATRELGLQCLKPKQREAIELFVSGKDVMVILPTGYGKSVLYGILPNLFDKIQGKLLYF